VVVFKGVVQSLTPVAQVTALDTGRAESNAAAVAFEGAAQLAPSEAQTEVAATATSPAGSGTAMAASEGAAQSAPPAVLATASEAGRMEENVAGGSPGVVTVVERTHRRSFPALLSGASRSPTRGEPLLQWMAAQDPTSVLFSLDDTVESLERENLDIGFSAMMGALREASGALREILVPSSRVSV